MKLAALGVVVALIGVTLDIPGLIGIGAFWIAVGPLMRMHGRRLKKLEAATPSEQLESARPAERRQAIDGRTFAIGTMLWLLLGVPSLAVGALEIGISGEDENWRWIPIAIGVFALGIGVISAVLYLLGGAVGAVAERGPRTEIPATLWIRSVQETGTYINERPRLAFEFQIEPDASTKLASYQATKKATVPFTAMAALRVGDGFRALVAGPENPSAMDIRWDEPVSADGGQAATSPQADVSSRLVEVAKLHREKKITDEEYQAQRDRILDSL
jgi:hypothetical protein